MAFISKDKIIEILKNAPEGTTPEGIISILRERGHELEGYQEKTKTIIGPVFTSKEKISELEKAERLKATENFKSSLPGKTISAVGNFSIGAAKSAIDTAAGIGELGQKAAGAIVNPAIKVLGGIPITGERPKALEEVTTPKNTAQTVGKAAGDIAQFFIPGPGLAGVVAKGEKAIGAAKVLANAPKIVKGVSKALPEVASEAIGAAAVTAAQQGDLDKNVLENALISGGATSLFKSIKPIAQKSSSRIINSLIKPQEKQFRFGKDPGAQIVKEGIFAKTLPDFVKKTAEKLKEANNVIRGKVSNASGEINAAKVINKEVGKLIPKVTDPNGAKKLQNIMDQIFYKVKFKDGELIKTGLRDLSKLTPKSLHKLQQKIGKLTSWTGEAYEKDINQMLSAVYRGLGKKLDNVVPGTKQAQMRSANLLEALKASERRANKDQGLNALLGLSPMVIGGLGAAGSMATGSSTPESALYGLAGLAGTKALGSSFFKTGISKFLKPKKGVSKTERLLKTPGMIYNTSPNQVDRSGQEEK